MQDLIGKSGVSFTASSGQVAPLGSSSMTNDSPDSGQSSASSATPQPNLQQSTDRKSVSDSIATPLSVVRLTPLSSFFNNKVGSSFIDQRQALINYATQSLQSALVLPVTSRKVRDSGSLLFMLAFLSFLGYIIWDGLVVKEADINLIVHGHDSYGNICGRNNRPIRLVEKSGRNYTSKPYTKYTLINAQFERYTLDDSRLKHGELYYVKESDRLLSSPSSERAATTASRGSAFRRRLSSGSESSASRIKRQAGLASQATLLTGDLARRNKTLLNDLKSKLMYQYPPMYGYNPTTSTTLLPPASRRASQEAPKWRIEPRINAANSGVTSAFRGSGTTQSAQLELAGSQMGPTYVSASLPAPISAVATVTGTTQRPQRSTTLTVIFDDHANDSDRYEHMLVTPTSTNNHITTSPVARSPDGLNLNEVSNQLLYLTECVDECPEDHLELIFYRCMPKNWRFSLFPNAINVTRTFIDDIVTDMSHCYRELIYIFSLALVLSLALLILLRFLASIIIWTCIALLVSLFISTASYSWINYYNQIIDLNNMMPHDSSYSDRLAASDKWLVGSIFLTFLAFATVATILFMRKRILLVTSLFRESGKAIADMPLLLLQPLLTFAALVTITAAWTMGLICLQSIKLPVIDFSTGFVVFRAEVLYKIMKWYHIFAFLWVSHFAIACQHYVIGAAVSKWYFSKNRYELGSPIGTSISELILYYLGSVALGSFLVAIFKVIRIITKQIQYLVQRNCMTPPNSNGETSGSRLNSASHLSPSCCGSLSYLWRIFIWFFDNIVMIINRDAYVEIAIYGHSFLGGARRAFQVLASNPLRLLAIKSVSNVLLVVAKICVVFGTTSVAMVLLDEKFHQLNYSWSPIVVTAIYSYIVAHWFLSVYEMVIDALFICYCEDYERSKTQETHNQIIGSDFMTQILNSGQATR